MKIEYIAKLEKAIKDKYGEDTINNYDEEWNQEKEKMFLEEIKGLYTKDQNSENQFSDFGSWKISNKLSKRESLKFCNVCSIKLSSTKDDIANIKYNCCYSCYIKWVEHREERWDSGWRTVIK